MKWANSECLVEAAVSANQSPAQRDSYGTDQSQQIKFRRTGLTRDRGAPSDPATSVRLPAERTGLTLANQERRTDTRTLRRWACKACCRAKERIT